MLFSSRVSSFWCALNKRQTYNDCFVQTFSLSCMSVMTATVTKKVANSVVSFAHIAIANGHWMNFFLDVSVDVNVPKKKNTNFHVWRMNCIWSKTQKRVCCLNFGQMPIRNVILSHFNAFWNTFFKFLLRHGTTFLRYRWFICFSSHEFLGLM